MRLAGAQRVGALMAAALLAGCAGAGRTSPGGPILPGGPLLARAAGVVAPIPDSLVGQFGVYRGDGTRADAEDVVEAFAASDVVFLGELHDDAVGHALQHWLLTRAVGPGRPVALGLEMFERDVQLVLDEYLAGTIRERDFLAASRPWSEYVRFYRPLVEFARENRMPVLATNAPGRYVNLVARRGAHALGAQPQARAFLPDLPVTPASPALAAKFSAMMASMPAHQGPDGPTLEGLLAAQNLRDASMADVIHRWLDDNDNGLVVHANGSFHSEGGLGIPEHLAREREGVRTLVITFRRSDDPTAVPARTPDDDFVIVTRSATEE